MIRGARTRVSIALVVALATAGIAGGCGGGGGGGNELELITPGTLLVGSDIPNPPFEQGHPPSTYTGFDIDLVNTIAKQLGVTPKYQDTALDRAFRDLAQGKLDMVASGATITKSERTIDFSNPYYIQNGKRYGFAFNKNNPDLRDAVNKQLAAMISKGAYALIYAKWFHKAPPKDFLPSKSG
jgi:ABC-type amino acid transport substrate-binding protein